MTPCKLTYLYQRFGGTFMPPLSAYSKQIKMEAPVPIHQSIWKCYITADINLQYCNYLNRIITIFELRDQQWTWSFLIVLYHGLEQHNRSCTMGWISDIGQVSWTWSALSVVYHELYQRYWSCTMDLISVIGLVPKISSALLFLYHGLDQHYRSSTVDFFSVIGHVTWAWSTLSVL
jgi:hypothetical protein